MLNRRSFMAAAGTSLGLTALGLPVQSLADAGLKLGKPEGFSFDSLIEQAKELARKPYHQENKLPKDVLERIDYDQHGKIIFNTDNALFKDGPGEFPVTFFHLGRYFQIPVHTHVLEKSGDEWAAKEIVYDPDYFSMPKDSPARELPKGAGFAGFRFQESRFGDQKKLDWHKNDWVAFLGASYFRAIGELYQYGLSARGIAMDVAMPNAAEEFPTFTHFYFEPPSAFANDHQVTVYALLEGPGITGAFKFIMQRTNKVLMDIDSHVFLRRDVGRLGFAPLTSMYWFSESVKQTAIDWRPEVHDSDGLALWTGNGEHIWRPLVNPPHTSASAFSDKAPRGFGLLQRDRNFDHYLDGVNYERRPSLWVEPVGDWGEGAVQLIEIPTDDEIHDNVVAFWVPSAPAQKGNAYHFQYKLHWSADEPYPTTLGRCVATRLGRGGQPGQPRPQGVRKFMVEFSGGPLKDIPFGVKPEVVLWSSSGHFSYVFAEAVPDGVPGHWRAQFDFTSDSPQPVDMRLYLKNGDQTLTETWLYQYHPF
ncbi:glucan biosynthesis protein D [Pokkaliibacter plantistimulans]|uniref:Glucans biosynthesis protein D n=1 Tax=Pokkaliibacter plantistimulans TaxID=1635171 RepID=A0ABX5M1D9_9GAMM|nr:glucan biosynthesis protein D [Pokkaliibacter plantistimulans]PXF32740.1 glucan biosynthesis protein D [Pokkaliibacter plantistimulans]